jgi:hypothetical protein
MRHIYFSNYNLAKPSRFKDISALVKQNLNSGLLHALHAIADSSDKLSPLVAGKHRSQRYSKNVRKLPIKYEANTHFWMTNKISENYITTRQKIGC